MSTRLAFVGTICAVILVCSACLTEGENSSELVGCTSDFDCKANRICVASRCIEPGTTGECTPSCSGNDCGPDGCGGSCGTCATNQVCENGLCIQADCGEESFECFSTGALKVCWEGEWQYINCWDFCEDQGQAFIYCGYNTQSGHDTCFCGTEWERCVYDEVFLDLCQTDPAGYTCSSICKFMEEVCFDPVCDNSSYWANCVALPSIPSTPWECLEATCWYLYEADFSNCP